MDILGFLLGSIIIGLPVAIGFSTAQYFLVKKNLRLLAILASCVSAPFWGWFILGTTWLLQGFLPEGDLLLFLGNFVGFTAIPAIPVVSIMVIATRKPDAKRRLAAE